MSLRQELELTNRSFGRLAAPETHVHDRLEATLNITQGLQNQRALCGNPVLVDPFGNRVAILTPNIVRKAELTHYAISVFITAPGQYILEFDNLECDIRKTPAKATVDWKLFRVEAD